MKEERTERRKGEGGKDRRMLERKRKEKRTEGWKDEGRTEG